MEKLTLFLLLTAGVIYSPNISAAAKIESKSKDKKRPRDEGKEDANEERSSNWRKLDLKEGTPLNELIQEYHLTFRKDTDSKNHRKSILSFIENHQEKYANELTLIDIKSCITLDVLEILDIVLPDINKIDKGQSLLMRLLASLKQGQYKEIIECVNHLLLDGVDVNLVISESEAKQFAAPATTALGFLLQYEKRTRERYKHRAYLIDDEVSKCIKMIAKNLFAYKADIYVGKIRDESGNYIDIAHIINSHLADEQRYPEYQTVCAAYKEATVNALKEIPALNAFPPGALPLCIAYLFGKA